MSQPMTAGRSIVHLGGDGAMTVAANEPAFWADRNRPELTVGSVLSVFSYSETWDYQERHDDGDELAVVLDGAVELLLDTGAGEHAVPVGHGELCVIPAGAWHRVAVHEPATILFVTPQPSRTQHRSVPTTRTVGDAGAHRAR